MYILYDIYVYLLHVCICNSTSRCSGLPTESYEPSRNPPDCRVAATVPEALAGGAGQPACLGEHVEINELMVKRWEKWWIGELVGYDSFVTGRDIHMSIYFFLGPNEI